jgi:hypothetical protein
MSAVVIETANRLDGKSYCASIVPQRQVIEYRPAPTSSGGEEPQSAVVTLMAITTRKSIFALRNPPLLVACYGIGRLEFDAFCGLVLEILSGCHMKALPSVPDSLAIDEICSRYGLTADHGEFSSSRFQRPVPFLMLFDRDSAARGY